MNQSRWLENISRGQLQNGLFVEHLLEGSIPAKGISVTPGACAHALRTTEVYDNAIRRKLKQGVYGEPLALELMIEDARSAADLLRPVFERSQGIDGWAALTIFPMSITDTVSMITAISTLYTKAMRPNIVITIPGTPQWLEAFEEAIVLGIPVTTAFLLSPEQFLAAAKAYLRGIERRIVARLNPVANAFASISFARLVAAFSTEHSSERTARIGIAVARRIYRAARELHILPEWTRIYTAGARPLCLIWQTDTLGDCELLRDIPVQGFMESFTATAMTEDTAQAISADNFSDIQTPTSGSDSEEPLSQYLQDKSELQSLTEKLQKDAMVSLAGTCIDLLDAISYKSALITECYKSD